MKNNNWYISFKLFEQRNIFWPHRQCLSWKGFRLFISYCMQTVGSTAYGIWRVKTRGKPACWRILGFGSTKATTKTTVLTKTTKGHIGKKTLSLIYLFNNPNKDSLIYWTTTTTTTILTTTNRTATTTTQNIWKVLTYISFKNVASGWEKRFPSRRPTELKKKSK